MRKLCTTGRHTMCHKVDRRRLVAPLVIGGMLLAACSDDGSDASPETTADQTVPEQTSPDPTSSGGSVPGATDPNLDPGTGSLPADDDSDNELEEVTPLVANVLATPRPVRGDDDLTHLAYELFVVNPTSSMMTVDQVEVLGPDGEVIGQLAGEELASNIVLVGSQESVGPAGTFFIFMDHQLPAGDDVPESISHRFTFTLTPDEGEPTDATVVSGAAEVDVQEAVVVGPPLRGANWVVAGGCCFPADYHRKAVLPVNGQFHAPERYAIDFIQLNDQGTLYDGPEDELSSFGYYGAEIMSVADGAVVRVQDDLPEQVPGGFAPGATAASAGGNFVVVDIGDGHYAFYAHLQPGSLTVAEGDEVTKGQVLGLLGNTGNSDGPHLHFHVMDGPGPLSSNGLPYRFESFDVQGTLTNTADLQTGVEAVLDDTLTGSFTDVLPLDNQLITFPE